MHYLWQCLVWVLNDLCGCISSFARTSILWFWSEYWTGFPSFCKWPWRMMRKKSMFWFSCVSLIFLGELQEHEQPFARQEGTFGSLEQNAVDIKTSTPQNLEEIIVLPSIKDDVLHQICKVSSFPAHWASGPWNKLDDICCIFWWKCIPLIWLKMGV